MNSNFQLPSNHCQGRSNYYSDDYDWSHKTWCSDHINFGTVRNNSDEGFRAFQPYLLQSSIPSLVQSQIYGDSEFCYEIGQAALGGDVDHYLTTKEYNKQIMSVNTINHSIPLNSTNEGNFPNSPHQYQDLSSSTVVKSNQEGFRNNQIHQYFESNNGPLPTSYFNMKVHKQTSSVIHEYQDSCGLIDGNKQLFLSQFHGDSSNSDLNSTSHRYLSANKNMNVVNYYQGASWFDYERESFVPSDALDSFKKKYKGYQDSYSSTSNYHISDIASSSRNSKQLPYTVTNNHLNDSNILEGNRTEDISNILRIDDVSEDSGFFSDADGDSSNDQMNDANINIDVDIQEEMTLTGDKEHNSVAEKNLSFSSIFNYENVGNSDNSSPSTEDFDDSNYIVTSKSRKRKRNTDLWKQSSAKKAKNSGISGVSKRGKKIKSRTLGPPCTCRSRCSAKCNESDRRTLFKNFWNLSDHNRQWDYLARKIVASQPKERRVLLCPGEKRRKNNSYTYFLTVNGNNVKVCRKMFLNTFGINKKWLETICKKKQQADGDFIKPDMRGRHANRVNKAPESVVSSVHEHINLFPRIESHYCRQSSTKQYLASDLSINKMYRLYKDWMEKKNEKSYASSSLYRFIFNNSYNISFHQPKKDQCDNCFAYDNLSAEDKVIKKSEYDEHVHKKDVARALMHQDIREAKENNFVACVQFDLQKVLNLPQTESSIMYYKRKISLYNFTFYNLATKEVLCKVWNETIAGRGSNEFASHMYSYLKELSRQGKEDVRFISDNCSGQNKNKNLFKMYIIASKEFNITITHRYLLTGHTQSAGDSVHSTIERAARKKSIYSQDEWCSIIETAKVTEPRYVVQQVSQSEIFDFTESSNASFWNKMKISQISSITVYPDSKIKCYYNYDEEYQIFTAPKVVINFKNCYTEKLPLAQDKIKDINDLCKKNLIPPQYHHFYNNLLN